MLSVVGPNVFTKTLNGLPSSGPFSEPNPGTFGMFAVGSTGCGVGVTGCGVGCDELIGVAGS